MAFIYVRRLSSCAVISIRGQSLQTFKSIPNCSFSTTTKKMSKPSVYITRKINEQAEKLLKQHCEVTQWTETTPVPRDILLKNIENKHGLFCMIPDKIDAEVLNKAGKNLKVVATMSVGFDHLDIQEMKKRNIKIGYTPTALTDATAELTVSLLLATSRRLFEANVEARNGGWQAWKPFWMCGPGLKCSTVGIVGFGRIGQQVARILKGFKPKKIIYFNRSQVPEEAEDIGAECVTFEQLLAESDFITLNAALTPETRHMFNLKAFKKMKPTAVFVNTSRGGLVDQDDLVCALKNKTIWGAGLDVTDPEPLPLDHPLFKLKNCVILPHIGSATIDARNAMGTDTAKNILAALKGEKLPFEVPVK